MDLERHDFQIEELVELIKSNSNKVITKVLLTFRKSKSKFIFYLTAFFPFAIISTGTNKYVKNEIRKISKFILKNTWYYPAE